MGFGKSDGALPWLYYPGLSGFFRSTLGPRHQIRISIVASTYFGHLQA